VKKTKSVKTIQQELQKLVPQGNKVSILHLAIAIFQGCKYFLTTDTELLKKVKKIKKQYSILIVSDPYSLYEKVVFGRERSPFEHYT